MKIHIKIQIFIIVIIITLILLFSILPTIFYIFFFHNIPISENPSDWGVFGDYIGGLSNPIIAFFNLIATIFIAIYLVKIENRRHDDSIHSPVKPYFTIKDGMFYSADISAISNYLESYYYDYEPPTLPADQYDYKNKVFHLLLSNKGLGIATDVEVIFEVSLEELRDKLIKATPLVTSAVSEIRVDEYGRSYVIFSVDAEEHFKYKILFCKIFAKETKYIGVVNLDETVKVNLPNDILTAFKFIHFFSNISKENIEFPVFTVNIKYKNIYNKEIQSKKRIGLLHLYNHISHSVFRLVHEQIPADEN